MSTSPNVPGGPLPSGAEQDKIAYSIAGLCAACSLGRTFVYQEIAAGRLGTLKAGRRTLIEAAEARRWLSSLRRITAPDSSFGEDDLKPGEAGAGGAP
jgi:hypothetical protein